MKRQSRTKDELYEDYMIFIQAVFKKVGNSEEGAPIDIPKWNVKYKVELNTIKALRELGVIIFKYKQGAVNFYTWHHTEYPYDHIDLALAKRVYEKSYKMQKGKDNPNTSTAENNGSERVKRAYNKRVLDVVSQNYKVGTKEKKSYKGVLFQMDQLELVGSFDVGGTATIGDLIINDVDQVKFDVEKAKKKVSVLFLKKEGGQNYVIGALALKNTQVAISIDDNSEQRNILIEQVEA